MIPSILWLLVTLLTVVFAFIFANLFPIKRTLFFLIGAFSLTVIGHYSHIFTLDKSWESIQSSMPIIILIVALEVFSLRISDLGIIDFATRKFLRAFKSPVWIQISLIGITYGLSLLMNNLATIVIVVPLALTISTMLGFKTKPFLVMIIIASNLGGASTLIGDFPNITISRYANADFLDFFINLGLPILLFLLPACIAIYYYFHAKKETQKIFLSTHKRFKLELIKGLYDKMSASPNKKDSIVVGSLFIGMLLCFIFWHFDPALIAGLFFAVLLLFVDNGEKLLRRVDLSILFLFIALFTIAGAVQSTGIFDYFENYLLRNSSSPLVPALFLLWTSAVATSFLSAGPTTALFVPFAMSLGALIPDSLNWWALSLGVLAGSSFTIIGSTAGPVTMLFFEKSVKGRFSFWDFSMWGIPIGLSFLAISSLYIWWRL